MERAAMLTPCTRLHTYKALSCPCTIADYGITDRASQHMPTACRQAGGIAVQMDGPAKDSMTTQRYVSSVLPTC